MNKAKFQNYAITATYTGEKPAAWNSDNYNHHTVTVRNTETGRKTSFDFWASIAHPVLESEYDIVNAFRCFVDDAISGGYTFEEFCQEFGYDTDSRTAERTWKACQRATKKLERLGGDPWELISSLDDYA